MKKIAMKICLISMFFMCIISSICSAVAHEKFYRNGVRVLSNFSIDIIRISMILIILILIILLILKLKNKLHHNVSIISSIFMVLIVFGCIVGVNRQNKDYVDATSLKARPVIIRIFDFSQW